MVEFKNDIHTVKLPGHPNGYLISEFDSMMYSSGYNYSPIHNNFSPDGENVNGSVNDYFKEMSLQQVQIQPGGLHGTGVLNIRTLPNTLLN